VAALAGRFHRLVRRWLWGYAGIIAVVLLFGWVTGSFETAKLAAVILMVVVVVGAGLLRGSAEWKAGRRFAAPKGRVLTSRQVMEQEWPILCIRHDADDSGTWQFVNGHGDTENEADRVTAHIQQLIERDPSICAVADMPNGWRARRQSEDAPWNVAADGEQHPLE
jgi:hypothetical protein